ncbi:uncharacterized protein Fot_36290 [Forsythia ovata]|uniref:C2H2-type domain-containing protein n=1 Tax=Forsythia ovata TaxID=205694 RepID=A0ABD1SP16_9LAMI
MEFPRAKVNIPAMSYAPETLKQSPTETVEEKRAGTGAVTKVGLPLDPSRSMGEMNRKLKLARHSTSSFQLSYPEASTTFDGIPVTHHVRERVYSCKYCHKKFSNKQALGGHQNAHTIERVIERNAREGLETNFGHVRGPSYCGMTSLPFQHAFNRGAEIFNQSMRNKAYNPQSMQHEMLANGHPNSNLPMNQEPHAPETLQGITIWPNPHLTNSQIIALSPGMENHTLNFWNPTFGSTRSNAGKMLSVSGGLSTASSRQSIHNTNVRAETNSQITYSTNEQCQDSELDLSLKL